MVRTKNTVIAEANDEDTVLTDETLGDGPLVVGRNSTAIGEARKIGRSTYGASIVISNEDGLVSGVMPGINALLKVGTSGLIWENR